MRSTLMQFTECEKNENRNTTTNNNNNIYGKNVKICAELLLMLRELCCELLGMEIMCTTKRRESYAL